MPRLSTIHRLAREAKAKVKKRGGKENYSDSDDDYDDDGDYEKRGGNRTRNIRKDIGKGNRNKNSIGTRNRENGGWGDVHGWNNNDSNEHGEGADGNRERGRYMGKDRRIQEPFYETSKRFLVTDEDGDTVPVMDFAPRNIRRRDILLPIPANGDLRMKDGNRAGGGSKSSSAPGWGDGELDGDDTDTDGHSGGDDGKNFNNAIPSAAQNSHHDPETKSSKRKRVSCAPPKDGKKRKYVWRDGGKRAGEEGVKRKIEESRRVEEIVEAGMEESGRSGAGRGGERGRGAGERVGTRGRSGRGGRGRGEGNRSEELKVAKAKKAAKTKDKRKSKG